MSTLILNGSINKNGDTEALLEVARNTLMGEVIEISAYHDRIKPCLGCKNCNGLKCIIKDKLSPIMDLETGMANEIKNVLIASPVRISGLTGSIMSLAERFQLWYIMEEFLKVEKKLTIKQGGLILVGGGYGSSVRAINQARYILEEMKATLLEKDIITSLNTDILPARKDKNAIENVWKMALRMNQND